MTTEPRSHPLPVPAQSWQELLWLEPRLRVIDRLIPMVGPEDDGGRVYFVLKSVISSMVGWARGDIESGECFCENPDDSSHPHSMFNGNALLASSDYPSELLPAAEKWLRSSEAYDLAMHHMMDQIE